MPRTTRLSRWLTGVLAITLMFATPTVAHAGPSDPVTIPDRNFAHCITKTLGLPAGTIPVEAQLATIASLSCELANVADLGGADKLTNLTDLNLRGSQISDLAPLARLTNLSTLNLGLNWINDLTPLAGLTNLTTLILYDNEISDLTPLAGLTNLTTLYLMRNRVSDVTPLAGLTNLTTLLISENKKISDVTPLRGLTKLANLQLTEGYIRDLTPLAGLTNLTALYVNWNQIIDLTPLAGLTNLTALGVSPQTIVLPTAQVGSPFPMSVNDVQGNSVPLTLPAGVTYADGALKYSVPGDFTLTFSGTGPTPGGGSYRFDGTVTQTATPAGTFTVSGTLTSGVSPIAGATVRVFDAATNTQISSTTSNSTGTYTVTGLTTTSVKVQASKAGYTTTYQDGSSNLATAAPVTLNPGTTTINIAVSSLQTVTGTVTSGGKPVAGATIAVFDATTGAGLRATSTNSNGAYAFAGLTATVVKVKFSKAGYKTVYLNR